MSRVASKDVSRVNTSWPNRSVLTCPNWFAVLGDKTIHYTVNKLWVFQDLKKFQEHVVRSEDRKASETRP